MSNLLLNMMGFCNGFVRSYDPNTYIDNNSVVFFMNNHTNYAPTTHMMFSTISDSKNLLPSIGNSVNNCLGFNFNSSIIKTNTNTYLQLNFPMTIEFFAYSTSTEYWDVFIYFTFNGQDGRKIQAGIENNEFKTQFRHNTQSTNISYNKLQLYKTWHHYALILTTTYHELFIDGNSVGKVPINLAADPTFTYLNHLYVGSKRNSYNFYGSVFGFEISNIVRYTENFSIEIDDLPAPHNTDAPPELPYKANTMPQPVFQNINYHFLLKNSKDALVMNGAQIVPYVEAIGTTYLSNKGLFFNSSSYKYTIPPIGIGGGINIKFMVYFTRIPLSNDDGHVCILYLNSDPSKYIKIRLTENFLNINVNGFSHEEYLPFPVLNGWVEFDIDIGNIMSVNFTIFGNISGTPSVPEVLFDNLAVPVSLNNDIDTIKVGTTQIDIDFDRSRLKGFLGYLSF